MVRIPQLSVLVSLLLALAVATGCGSGPSTTSGSATHGDGGEGTPAGTSRQAAAAPQALSPRDVAARLHHGLDVSDHSGSVDWRQVEAGGHTFAFIKATEGVDLKDPAFDLHWPQLKEAGLVRGAYHFYVTEDDPEEQARFFIETVTLEPGDLAPVVDVELIGHGTHEGLPERLRLFLDRLYGHYGVKPIVYTTAKFWDEHFTAEFGDHPLWVAEYDVDEPKLPAGWKSWHLWQWRGDATVPGVEKGADLSQVNRSGVDLAALVVPGPATDVEEEAALEE
jgi:lysozyme